MIKKRTLEDFYAAGTLGSPENAVGFMLWKLLHHFQRAMDRELLPLDLTHLQFTTLAIVGWLNRCNGPATQAEISRRADIHVMQLSQILKVLEVKRMILRKPSPTNSRAKAVELTPVGLSCLRRAMPIAIEIQHRLFGKSGEPGGRLLNELQAVYRAEREAPRRRHAHSHSRSRVGG